MGPTTANSWNLDKTNMNQTILHSVKGGGVKPQTNNIYLATLSHERDRWAQMLDKLRGITTIVRVVSHEPRPRSILLLTLTEDVGGIQAQGWDFTDWVLDKAS